MIIKEFGHLAFNVSDMDRALHFYCDILGLEKAFSIRVPEDIAKRADLEDETVEEVMAILRAEFED